MMPNDQPETPGEAKPVAAAGGALPPETPPQALANTARPGDTESVPDPPDGENSVSAVEEATLPPRSVQPASSAEGATRPPRSVFDAPQSRPGNACVNEGACSRLETSWFDGDPLKIEACLEQVPAPELPDTTEELVCIEMEFLWKQSVSASQGDNTSDAESSNTGSSTPTSLEDYLKRFPQLDTPQRMERLVSEELACRLQIHAAIDSDNYRQRFPDLIADNSWVQQRVDTIQRLGKSMRRSRSERTVTPWQTADADAAPGLRSFGDYELLQEIARGGMGVVYKARQTKLNRVVALKMILSGQLASQEDVQRFYVEAEAAASLDHPGIVPIYEIGEHDEQHFFSMGFIEGASLESQVKDGPPPSREAAAVTRRVSEAIAYAHARGVIHRDLKPANILIDSGGEPKVTDFGLAKKTDVDSGLTGTGQILGTPGYMPPEQASGETATIGRAADIYSLGAILYALLTGRPPFQSATAIDTLVAVLEQEPVAPRQLNPALDADLETICLKCLQKDIKRRYATADELVAELGRYLNGEPIHARPIGKLERGWRWCKRKPALAGLSGLAALLLLTLGIGGPLVAYQFKTALSAQLQAERERRVVQARALRQATPQAAAMILKELDLQSGDVQEALRSQLSDSSLPADETNRVRLGLLKSDREQLEPIVEFVLSESGQRLKPAELLLIRDVLSPYGSELTSRCLPLLETKADRLRAGCFLAGFAADGDFWSAHADDLTADLVRVLPSELTPYREALRPVQEHLIAPLTTIFRDNSAGEQVRSFATDTLADYLSDDAQRLFDLLADANEKQFGPLFNVLTAHQQQAIVLGNAEVARTPSDAADEDEKESLAIRQANTAVMLLRMHAPDQVWPLLKHSSDPRVRSYLIHWLNPRGGDFQTILDRYGQETDVTIKRALLLCLGECDLPDDDQQSLIETLLDVYRNDPDAGLHAAAEWLLRQWKQGDQLAAIDAALQQSEAELRSAENQTRQWFINGQGQTYVILDADTFQMGSPESEPDHNTDEIPHTRRINRRFAISSKEVTKAQWRKFSTTTEVSLSADNPQVAIVVRTDDSPMTAMTWFEAAWYCNWLSAQDGIARDQWCYLPNSAGLYGPGMKAQLNFLQLTGYRLPTEPEWEFACRAGSVTARHYGLTIPLLSQYARHGDHRTARPVASLKPNDVGLFDIQGNAYEWCYDLFQQYPVKSASDLEDSPGTQPVLATDRRILRGGSFDLPPRYLRSAYRFGIQTGSRDSGYGFRPVKTYR